MTPKPIHVAVAFTLAVMCLDCASSGIPTLKEQVHIRMNDTLAEVLNFDSLSDIAPPETLAAEVEPKAILMMEAEYPSSQLQFETEGDVFVKCWVTKNGNVKRAVVLKSTEPAFNRSALKAAVMWKFRPAIVDGQPKDVWVLIPFRFRMHP